MKNLFTLTSLFFILVTASEAQILHQKAYSTNNASGGRPDIAWSPTDRTFVIGQLESGDSITWGSRVRVMKVDTTGYPIWTQQFSFETYSQQSINVAVGANGNIYCAGYVDTDSSSNIAYFIMEISPWGTLNWSKSYLTNSYMPYEYPDIKVLPTGELLLTESVYGHMGYIKTDLSGNLIEAVSISEDTTAENKTPGFASAVLADGSFLFTGKRNSDIALVHTDNSGNILWSSLWNSGASYYHAKNILALSDGSSIVCGMETNNQPFLMRVDSNGNKVWYKLFSDQGTFYDIQALDDSTFVACGDFGSSFSTTMARFDGDGNILETVHLPYDATIPMYFYSPRLLINPDGFIGLGGNYSIGPSYTPGYFFMTMDQLTTSGCILTADTLYASTTAQDPSIVAMPLYSKPQPIAVANRMPEVTNVPQNYMNFCWVVSDNMHDPISEGALQIQNSLVQRGGELSFTLGNYSGEFTCSVYDQLGREVVVKHGDCSPSERIVLSDEATRTSGVYTIVITTGNTTMSEKYVVY